MNGLPEKLLTIFSWLALSALAAALVFLLGFLWMRGLPTLGPELLFGHTPPLDALLFRQQVFDGLFPAVCGTLLLVLLSMLLALPLGIPAGIYMAEYAGGRLRRLFNLFFDILAGIPSIVIGLAGLSLTIFLHRVFPGRVAPSLLVSGLALAMLVLPYLIRTTQTALEQVDPLLRATAPALGASRLQNILRVLLPSALPDITGGIILATARCAEDTAVIMLTGAVASAGLPGSLLDRYEALPFTIYTISAQYGSPEELAVGFGAAVLLLFLCMGLLLAALGVQRRLSVLLLYR